MSMRWSRRAFASAAVALLFASRAHAQPVRQPRIGLIIGDGVPQLVNAFRDELSKLGWVDGKTIVIEQRLTRANTDDARTYSAELASLDLDLIVASALPFALLIRDANPRMPMVIGMGPALVSNGLANSMEHPGGVVTGSDELPPGLTSRRLELLKTAAPGTKRVGLLSTTPGKGGHEAQVADAEANASRLGVVVKPYRATNRAEIQQALEAMTRDGMDGLLNFQGGQSVANRQMIVDFAAERRMPAIYQSQLFAEAGGLMAWAPDQPEQMREAARYVDRILRGERPGDLPITHPSRYFLTLNRRAADRIGLTFPPSLLSIADQVIS